MNESMIYEVITALVGPIDPIGETNADNKSFENLKTLTKVTDRLIFDIDRVGYNYKNNHQHSMKKASEFAVKFLNELALERKV